VNEPTIVMGDHALTVRRPRGGVCRECQAAADHIIGGHGYCADHGLETFTQHLQGFRDEAIARAQQRMLGRA
jgi:hypothetical protein